MAWKQVRTFNLKKMGTRKGWCEMNCRLSIGGETGHFPSAKADMESQRKNGTLHDISTLPKDVAVPIFCDTASQYEHIIMCDRGVCYSDGLPCKLSDFKVFGWGELVDGYRVVEWCEDTKQSFLPEKGYWTLGDTDIRIGKLAKFMYKTFPSYTSKLALGNYFGKNLTASLKEFQKRVGLVPDGSVGKLTYKSLTDFGFRG